MYTINIYKFTLLKVGKRKKKYFELLESYKHIDTKDLTKKDLELRKKYNDWNIYTDFVNEKTKHSVIKEGMK